MPEPPFDWGEYDAGRDCNYWQLNPPLQAAAERVYPSDEFAWAEPQLASFGRIVREHIADNADTVESNPPELRTYDRHGNRSNQVTYHPAQHENERLIYERGIVADAFRAPPDRDEPVGLIHTLTMQFLLAYVDTGLVCSQSMTSGAALVLDRHDPGHLEGYLDRLTTRDPERMIEGAMFLTEEQGGSDVGATETVAEPLDGEARTYRLTGEKWFCSNIDAQATLALARRPDAPEGTAGLSLFLVPHRLPDGELNDQTYRRLKDKLGTNSVPTGEVVLEGATGYLVGEPERGFKYMTTMLNFERVTNAVGAVGIIGRLFLESVIHANNRAAFGEPLAEKPLMQRDLVELAVDHEATLAFAMETSRWFDAWVRDPDDEAAYRLMRVLVPVAKHVTTRTAVDTASYAMEIQGGNGYVADFVTHRLLRDAQALPIWEGTANILALDVLRGLGREATHEALLPLVDGYLDGVEAAPLAPLVERVTAEREALETTLLELAAADPDRAQHEAKRLTEAIYDVLTAALLLERADTELADGDGRAALIAALFVRDAFSDDGIATTTEGPAIPLSFSEEILRYGSVDPETLPDLGARGRTSP